MQWRTNLAAMSRVAAGQSLTVNQLVDMEWKFGGLLVGTDLVLLLGPCRYFLRCSWVVEEVYRNIHELCTPPLRYDYSKLSVLHMLREGEAGLHY